MIVVKNTNLDIKNISLQFHFSPEIPKGIQLVSVA